MKGGGVEHMKKHLLRATVVTAIGITWFYNYFIVPRDKLYAQFWGNPDFEKDMDERFKRQRAAGIFDQKFNVMLDDDEMTLYKNAPMPLDEYIAHQKKNGLCYPPLSAAQLGEGYWENGQWVSEGEEAEEAEEEE